MSVWVEWEFSGREGLSAEEEVDAGESEEGNDDAEGDPEREVGFFAGVLGDLQGGCDLCGCGGLFGGTAFLSEGSDGGRRSGAIGGGRLEVMVSGGVVVGEGRSGGSCGGAGGIGGVSSNGRDGGRHAEDGGVVIIPFFDLGGIGGVVPLFRVAFGWGGRGGIVPRGLVAARGLAIGERRGGSGGLLYGGVVRAGVGWIAAPDRFVIGVIVLGVCDGGGRAVWGLCDGLCDGGGGIFLFFHLVELLDKLLELERADGFAPILDKAFDIPLEFAGGLIAFIAVFGESAVDDGGELFGEVRSVLLDGDGSGVEDRTEHIDIGFSVEGSVVGGEFVHDDAKGKDIAASVEDEALDLFGRHVGELAFDGACLGFLGGLGFGDPEVDDLDDALEGEDDVLGGDIAVDQVEVMAVGIAEAVGIFETFADL